MPAVQKICAENKNARGIVPVYVIFPLPLFVQSDDPLNVVYANVLAAIEDCPFKSGGVTVAAVVMAVKPDNDDDIYLCFL